MANEKHLPEKLIFRLTYKRIIEAGKQIEKKKDVDWLTQRLEAVAYFLVSPSGGYIPLKKAKELIGDLQVTETSMIMERVTKEIQSYKKFNRSKTFVIHIEE